MTDVWNTLDEWPTRHVRRKPVHPFIWKTRDGQYISVTDMEFSHLCNTIRFMRRTFDLERYRRSIPPFPNFNGDMAQLFAEQEWERECERREQAKSIRDVDSYRAMIREYTDRLIEQRRAVITQRASFT
jgi:hypothetical protein